MGLRLLLRLFILKSSLRLQQAGRPRVPRAPVSHHARLVPCRAAAGGSAAEEAILQLLRERGGAARPGRSRPPGQVSAQHLAGGRAAPREGGAGRVEPRGPALGGGQLAAEWGARPSAGGAGRGRQGALRCRAARRGAGLREGLRSGRRSPAALAGGGERKKRRRKK